MLDEEDGLAYFEAELAEISRRAEVSARRIPLEAQARVAQECGDHDESIALWKQARVLALQEHDEFELSLFDGQFAEALVRADRAEDAIVLLEASMEAGNGIPAVLRTLADLLIQRGRIARAFEVQRTFWKRFWDGRTLVPRGDLTPQIVSFAKRWKTTGSVDCINFAEQWATETDSRDALFAVRHERAAMLEKADDTAAALELYSDAIRAGSRHESTRTRAVILLERAKRLDEALALARASLGIGLSASFEEQTNKRIVGLEGKRAGIPKKKISAKDKAVVPAFTVRSGADRVRFLRQVDVKGGISSAIFRGDEVFAISGAPQKLWRIGAETDSAKEIRAVAKRSRLYSGSTCVLISKVGTVSKGEAHVEFVDGDWSTVATVALPGITSEVAVTRWGYAIGCRSGGLHALDWSGRERWRFVVPALAEGSGFGGACPYLVDCAADAETVVFSSFTDVYAVHATGELAWKWQLPMPAAQVVNELISIQMPAGSISSVRATGDGGAYVASQRGQIYQLDSRGRAVWSSDEGYSTSQIVLDDEDNLVAVARSNGLALRGPNGRLATVFEAHRSPTVLRGPRGQIYAVYEGEQMSLVTNDGTPIATIEFSKKISDVGLLDTVRGLELVVAAGKLARFAL